MSLEWHEIKNDGPPEANRVVVIVNIERHLYYDIGTWHNEWDGNGYWGTRGEMRAVRLDTFTHWAYFEGPVI